ncbi:protein of unknown function [Latilactobacillus sakei]|nr:protein of unknown function [Latilactobacillus sakei]
MRRKVPFSIKPTPLFYAFVHPKVVFLILREVFLHVKDTVRPDKTS